MKFTSIGHFLIVLVLLCFGENTFAQQSRDTLYLTLDDAISKALENNWDIRIANEEIKKSHEQINEAYANAFPRLDFSGQYVRNIKLPVLFIPPNTPFNPSSQTQTFELGSQNSYIGSLTLSQVIFSKKVNTAIKIASEYSQFSEIGSEAAKQQIILNVKKTFYSILLMEELVKVSEKSYEAAKANYENVEKLYKQGVASEYDLLRSEVQLANSQPMLIQSENNLKLTKSSLKNILAIDINQPIEVKGKFIFEEVSREILEELSQSAVKKNAIVRQLSIQASLLDKNISIERADYFPTLSLFGQYQYQTQSNDFRIKDYKWVQTFMVGLQLTYTLFDGFSRNARIEQAVIDKEKVELNKQKITEGLKVQVQQARMKMGEAKKRIAAQGKSLQQAEKAMNIAETRYKSGVGTQLEIIDTQAALTFARTNYSQAIYDYLIAKSDWEYAVSE